MQIRVAPQRPSALAYFQYAARLGPCGTRVSFETCPALRLGELAAPAPIETSYPFASTPLVVAFAAIDRLERVRPGGRG